MNWTRPLKTITLSAYGFAWESYTYHKDQINKWIFYIHVASILLIMTGLIGRGLTKIDLSIPDSQKIIVISTAVFGLLTLASGIFCTILHHHLSAKVYRLTLSRLRDLWIVLNGDDSLSPYMIHRLYISNRKKILMLNNTSMSPLMRFMTYIYTGMFYTVLFVVTLYISGYPESKKDLTIFTILWWTPILIILLRSIIGLMYENREKRRNFLYGALIVTLIIWYVSILLVVKHQIAVLGISVLVLIYLASPSILYHFRKVSACRKIKNYYDGIETRLAGDLAYKKGKHFDDTTYKPLWKVREEKRQGRLDKKQASK